MSDTNIYYYVTETKDREGNTQYQLEIERKETLVDEIFYSKAAMEGFLNEQWPEALKG